MRLSTYMSMEQAIVHGEGEGIYRRWRWGHRLLRDDKRVTPNGNLRHGVIAELIEIAKAKGYKLSEREIQRRLRCAKTYLTEAQIRHIVADFKTWRDLAEANFPAAELDDPGPLYDPRWESEKLSIERIYSRAAAERWQAVLPGFDPYITLGEVQKRLAEQQEITAKRTQNELAMAVELQALIDAVDGDLSATWEEAQQALNGDDPDHTDDTEPEAA